MDRRERGKMAAEATIHDRYEFIEQIGTGSFGEVYMAIEKANVVRAPSGEERLQHERKVSGI